MSTEASNQLPPMANDLNAPAEYVNMYRIRGDQQNMVIDFGYLPPLMKEEAALLKEEPIGVSSRLILPYELVPQLIANLQQTLDSVKG